MNDDDEPPQEGEAELLARLAELRQAHQDLDDSIAALAGLPQPDLLQIARLKRQKLAMRDRIQAIEDRLTPDIIA